MKRLKGELRKLMVQSNTMYDTQHESEFQDFEEFFSEIKAK